MDWDPTNAAHQLLGLKLDGGWSVIERVEPSPAATGGCFSVGYIVQRQDGKRGFLKALDFSSAHRTSDPPKVIEAMTAAFNFERELLDACRRDRMSRIALALADGTVDVPGGFSLPRVSYVILELADADARTHLALAQHFDVAWRLRSLHHVATGLNQLHSKGISHQDVKPSNVLVFGNSESKLGDLGRASLDGRQCPFDKSDIPGDRTYAPPELKFHRIDPDWRRRRLGSDLYQLGSLAMFFFSGVATTPALVDELHPDHRPGTWGDDYQSVLPYVREAFNSLMIRFETHLQHVVPSYHVELAAAVRYLCDPDPALRGHPRDRWAIAAQHSLARFISLFDRLASRAEFQFRRMVVQ
jgi:serine/threonine protein kinase